MKLRRCAKLVLGDGLADPVNVGGDARVDRGCTNGAAGIHAPGDDANLYGRVVLVVLDERTARVALLEEDKTEIVNWRIILKANVIVFAFNVIN